MNERANTDRREQKSAKDFFIFFVTFLKHDVSVSAEALQRIHMAAKLYKMRSLTATNGKNSFVDLDLEFEGKRAFAIWDSVLLGNYQIKARLELDPRLLQKVAGHGCDFFYRGELVLPHPQNN